MPPDMGDRAPLRPGEPQALRTLVEALPEKTRHVVDKKAKTRIEVAHTRSGGPVTGEI
jgi:hypothetical protein